MAFQFLDPTLPREWVGVLNETLGYIKAELDAHTDNLTDERDAARLAASRATELLQQAQHTVLSLSERVANLEARVARMERR